MFRKTAPVTVFAAALLLAGCSSPQALTDSDYLRLVKQNVTELADHSNADIRKDGQLACETLAGKDGWVQAVAALTQAGFTGRDAGEFIAYAAGRYCPNLKNKLPS